VHASVISPAANSVIKVVAVHVMMSMMMPMIMMTCTCREVPVELAWESICTSLYMSWLASPGHLSFQRPRALHVSFGMIMISQFNMQSQS